MDDINSIFARREIDFEKLKTYGFYQDKQGYFYSRDLINNQFVMNVRITVRGKISTTIVDKATGDDYILHRITSAVGSFVGKLRLEYEKELMDIAKKCCVPDIFKTKQAKEIIQYIKNNYHNELEFLWPRSPENAIFRRNDNAKWYCAILTVESKKLGINSGDKTEIIDLKMSPDDIHALVDGKKYFPGYHMNKKHWVTICLNGSVSIEEIFMRIDNSFKLAE